MKSFFEVTANYKDLKTELFIGAIKIDKPITAISFTFWEKIKILFGYEMLIYTDASLEVTNIDNRLDKLLTVKLIHTKR